MEATREETMEETRDITLHRRITGIVVIKTKVLRDEGTMGKIDDHMTVVEAATAEVGIIGNLRNATRTAHGFWGGKHSDHCIWTSFITVALSDIFYNEGAKSLVPPNILES